MVRIATLLPLCAIALAAQADVNRLGLPDPPKPDVPYLIHGSELRELQQAEASEELAKNQLKFWIAGEAAGTRTPLAAPEFLLDSQQLDPRDLKLYRFEASKGRRELLYRKKKKIVAEPFFLQLEGIHDRVVRIRINASLSPGEYGLTPDGSNAVFAFAVF